MVQLDYITESIKKLGFQADFSKDISDVLDKNEQIKCMSDKSAYRFVLLALSTKFKFFSSILKNSDLFDISFSIDSADDTKIKEIEKELEGKIEYIYSEKRDDSDFVGIKLKQEICEIENIKLYSLIGKCFPHPELIKFNEIIVEVPSEKRDVKNILSSLISEISAIKLNVSISNYTLYHEKSSILPFYNVDVYIAEANKWPDDKKTSDLIKMAFYNCIFEKIKYGIYVFRDFIILKYKELYFKIKLVVIKTEYKNDSDLISHKKKHSSIEKRDEEKHNDITKKYIIESELHNKIQDDDVLARRIKMIKMILSYAGVYQILVDDVFIDAVGVAANKNTRSDGMFINKFFGMMENNKILRIDLETLNTELFNNKEMGIEIFFKTNTIYNFVGNGIFDEISKKIKNVSLLNSDCKFVSDDLLKSFIDESKFTFILSRSIIDDLDRNYEMISNGTRSELILGKPIAIVKKSLIKETKKFVDIYFNAYLEILYVKVKEGVDSELFENLIINETSFLYIYK